MPSRVWRVALPLLAVGLGLAACSLLVPIDDTPQCSTTADCLARGTAFGGSVCVNSVCVAPTNTGPDATTDTGAPDAAPDTAPAVVDAGPWGCVNGPPSSINPSLLVTANITTFDALDTIVTAGQVDGGSDFNVLTYTPVPGLTIQPCNVYDPACAHPVDPPQVTDDAGRASFSSLPGSSLLFFSLTGAGYLPSTIFPGQFPQDSTVFEGPFALLNIQELDEFSQYIQVPIEDDAGVGQFFFLAYDCYDHHASGVTFDLGIDAGSNSKKYYIKSELPSTTATETDSLGAGGQVNVPAGTVTVTATLAATGQVIGTNNIVIQNGVATFAFVRGRSH